MATRPGKKRITENIKLDRTETEALKKSFNSIRQILGRKSIDIEDIIGLVTTRDIGKASQQVTIRISEESVSQMNMIAFD